jgi:hypothetical protein
LIAVPVVIFFFMPLALRAGLFVFEDPESIAHSYGLGTADMSSIGLLPAAESHPAARVLIMSAPMSGQRGKFLTHSWVVLKRENSSSWSRYYVLGYASPDTDGARFRKTDWWFLRFQSAAIIVGGLADTILKIAYPPPLIPL